MDAGRRGRGDQCHQRRNTAGFGNLADQSHLVWTGDFTGVGQDQVLFFYQGVGENAWWLGTIAHGQMSFTQVATNTVDVLDSSHSVLVEKFNASHQDTILVYSASDSSWQLGHITPTSMSFSPAGTEQLGQLTDHAQVLVGDFLGSGRTRSSSTSKTPGRGRWAR